AVSVAHGAGVAKLVAGGSGASRAGARGCAALSDPARRQAGRGSRGGGEREDENQCGEVSGGEGEGEEQEVYGAVEAVRRLEARYALPQRARRGNAASRTPSAKVTHGFLTTMRRGAIAERS